MNTKGLRYTGLLLLVMSLLFVAGCSNKSPSASAPQDPTVDLVRELQTAANTLLNNTSALDPSKPVITTTFASIDDLQQSSTFGRQAAEIFASAMTRTGVPVLEVKMRDSLYMREGTGELLLSRELRHVTSAHNAQAVLVGTYAVGGSQVYVNVRVIRSSDNVILGTHNFSLPINRDIRSMLPRR